MALFSRFKITEAVPVLVVVTAPLFNVPRVGHPLNPRHSRSKVVCQVANADSLFASSPNFFAFGNLAGPNSDATRFDWGLPFFFGRNVFSAIEGQNTPAGPEPFVAY